MSGAVEVLFVDDEADLRTAATQMLELAGHKVTAVGAAEDAMSKISRSWNGVLVSDIRMPGMDGMELLRRAVSIDPDLPVLLVTGHGDVALAVEAMRTGAYDFIEKPFAPDRFLDAISRACEKRLLTLENRHLRESVSKRPDDIETRLPGRSKIMIDMRRRMRAIAETPADILIIGAPGTGKETVARAIHDMSPQRDRPFVAINCAALPEHMVEAELFGYEAGAFPGAIRSRFGKLEHARNGTLFLDYAHAMSAETQVKMLQVVQDRRITRLGSDDPIDLNCRIIGASVVDPADAPDAQVFSIDLLHRLNVIALHVPSLAERIEDIPAQFALMVEQSAARLRREPPLPPSEAIISSLLNREWRGNLRDLRTAAERYVLGIDVSENTKEGAATGALSERVSAFEKQAIAAELKARNGQLKSVYEALNISRKTLYEKMQKYGLDREDYRK